MALLDGIVGNGGLLDVGNLLGGNGGDSTSASQSSSDTGLSLGTAPALGLSLDDLLHNQSMDQNSGGGDSSMSANDFTGLGHASIGFQAPTFLGVSTSQEHSDYSQTDSNGGGGGLLGGIL
jgi:hypothetical protein